MRDLMSGSVERMWCIRICETSCQRDTWSEPSNVAHVVELACEEGRAAELGLGLVRRVVLEERPFGFESRRDGLGVVDITLAAVDDWDVAKTQRNDTSSENIYDVCSLVPGAMSISTVQYTGEKGYIHQVDLGEYTDRPQTLRVDFTRHLQTVRVGEILVGSGNGENDTTRLGDILHEHIADLLLDVLRLVSNGNLRQAGQIDEGECEHVRRVNAQVDRQGRDACVAARLGFGIAHDLVANLVEVVELLAGEMEELAPFVLVVLVLALDVAVRRWCAAGYRSVDQLQYLLIC